MKMLALILMATALVGCGCKTMVEYQLQPGEKIVFESQARADEFRTMSGNDQGHSNRWVEIDQPTSLVPKR